jgi:hypothetical protein
VGRRSQQIRLRLSLSLSLRVEIKGEILLLRGGGVGHSREGCGLEGVVVFRVPMVQKSPQEVGLGKLRWKLFPIPSWVQNELECPQLDGIIAEGVDWVRHFKNLKSSKFLQKLGFFSRFSPSQ